MLYHRALSERMSGGTDPARAWIDDSIRLLRDLSANLPANPTVHRWLGQAFLVKATLAESPEAAEDAWRGAVDALQRFVSPAWSENGATGFDSGAAAHDWRLLLPWTIANTCLDAATPGTGVARAAVAEAGYSEPGLDFNCR